MIDRITLRGSPYAHNYSKPSELRDEGVEVMEIKLRHSNINVALAPCYLSYDPRRETRAEYGERLRRAVREAGHYLEKALFEELARMGHLV